MSNQKSKPRTSSGKDVDHWLFMARRFLYTHGHENGDVVTLSFEDGGTALAGYLKQAYDQGRKDERGEEINAF